MAEQLSGALPLQHKRPDTGVFIDAHGREGSNGTNLIKVLILFCFLFFYSVSCNRERLSCEPGWFGFNDTNAIMRLKKKLFTNVTIAGIGVAHLTMNKHPES